MDRSKSIWEWGLLGVLVIFPWQTIWLYDKVVFPGASFVYQGIGLYAVEALIWLLALGYIVLFFSSKRVAAKPVWRKDRVAIVSVSIFVLYVLASVLWSPLPHLAHARALQLFAAVISMFMLMSSRWKSTDLRAALLIGAILPTVLGLWQFFSQTGFDSTLLGIANHAVNTPGSSIIQGQDIGRWVRAYGPFAHPNVFGGYLAFMSIIAISQGAHAHSRIKNIATGVLLALMSMAILATFSRSAWVAVTVGALIYGALHARKKHTYGMLGSMLVGVVCFLLMFAPLVSFRIFGTSTHQIASITDRVDQYGDAAAIISAHPVVGTGVGNYEAAVFAMDSERSFWVYQPVHNVFALLLAELGALGWILLFASILLSARAAEWNKKKIGLGLIVGAPFIVVALVDHYLWTSFSGLLLVAISMSFFQKCLQEEQFLL